MHAILFHTPISCRPLHYTPFPLMSFVSLSIPFHLYSNHLPCPTHPPTHFRHEKKQDCNRRGVLPTDGVTPPNHLSRFCLLTVHLLRSLASILVSLHVQGHSLVLSPALSSPPLNPNSPLKTISAPSARSLSGRQPGQKSLNTILSKCSSTISV